jgi:hypothetical protein
LIGAALAGIGLRKCSLSRRAQSGTVQLTSGTAQIRKKNRRKGVKLLQRALVVLVTLAVIAGIAAVVTPKRAHAIVATFVQVVNTPSQPVPTLEADVQTAFVAFNGCTFGSPPDDNPAVCEIVPLYNVPGGKTAVIESFSGVCHD